MKVVVRDANNLKLAMRWPRRPRCPAPPQITCGQPRCFSISRLFVCGAAITSAPQPEHPSPHHQRKYSAAAADLYEKLDVEDLSSQLSSAPPRRSQCGRRRHARHAAYALCRLGRVCGAGTHMRRRITFAGKKRNEAAVEAASGGDRKAPSDETTGARTPGSASVTSVRESISGLEFEKPLVLMSGDDVKAMEALENACRQFRSHLIEMVTHDKDLNDLVDVEELVSCYQNLRCPFYREILGRFYADLCSELFLPSGTSSEDDRSSIF